MNTIEAAAENYRVGEGADKTERYLEKAFIAGAVWQQSQQPKEADGWISVEDRLPSENKEVLAIEIDAFGDMDRIIAQWTGEYWYSPFKARKVTHWQPLPLPPKK